MIIDENFLNLIAYKNSLNEEQFKILGLSENSNWQEKALNKEVSKNDANLLMLLKGSLSHKAQEQIIKNYHMVLEFNNIKPKVIYEIPKYEIPKEQVAPTPEPKEEEEFIKIYCDGHVQEILEMLEVDLLFIQTKKSLFCYMVHMKKWEQIILLN